MADTDADEKLAYFQAITGVDDVDLCTDILSAHNWDLDLAISSFTSTPSSTSRRDLARPAPPGLAWRLATIPFYAVSTGVGLVTGAVGLVTGAVGLGFWIAGGVLSRSLNLLGLLPRDPAAAARLLPQSPSAAEAADFVLAFEREYGAPSEVRPRFVGEGFADALRRAQREHRQLFVYLHSPDHPEVPAFCNECLCSGAVAEFLNENFVCWGGSIRRSEGFKMSNSLRASCFPYCAVVWLGANQQIDLLEQIEGSKSPEQMLGILQQVVERSVPALVAARLQDEERRNNIRLREEQDAAYRAALEADQARDRQRKEEQERLEREAAEAERKKKEEEEAKERVVHEAAEKEAAVVNRRQEKALLLGIEPEKGPEVTQVLVRFPTGERRERRFPSSATIKSLYDFVDSLDCLDAGKYILVSGFPRIIFGPEKYSLTLKEAGLHPQVSMYVEAE